MRTIVWVNQCFIVSVFVFTFCLYIELIFTYLIKTVMVPFKTEQNYFKGKIINATFGFEYIYRINYMQQLRKDFINLNLV